MFTGLIREIGTIRRIARRSSGPGGDVLSLTIVAPATAAEGALGDSIAVQGICLTVTALQRDAFTVEAAAETRRLTTLRTWRAGRRVHLEPALRAGQALGGHFVLGHVDGVGRVESLRRAGGGGWTLTVAYPAGLGRWLAPKGSVAIDGVSLTVDEGPFAPQDAGSFTVNLIPHTAAHTLLADLRRGDPVNLEMDALVKAAGRSAGQPAAHPAGAGDHAGSLTLQRILAAGFLRSGDGGTS